VPRAYPANASPCKAPTAPDQRQRQASPIYRPSRVHVNAMDALLRTDPSLPTLARRNNRRLRRAATVHARALARAAPLAGWPAGRGLAGNPLFREHARSSGACVTSFPINRWMDVAGSRRRDPGRRFRWDGKPPSRPWAAPSPAAKNSERVASARRQVLGFVPGL
jgi:hypothetical protein